MVKKLAIFFIITFCFSYNVKAVCYDKELNDWALNTEIKFIEFDRNLINEETGEPLKNSMQAAYILSTTVNRDDIVMKATTNKGYKLEGKYIPGHKVYGITDYTPLEKVEYEITIYGGKDSACPNEVLKVLDYEVEPFNFYFKTQKCEDYPDAPLCKQYLDTNNITLDKFNKEMDIYIEENVPKEEPKGFDAIIDFMLNYGIYVLIPFVVISAIYLVKIRKLKKEEGGK